MASTQAQTTLPKDELVLLLREQNELLREQVAAFKKERSENTLSYKELVYIQRQMLPEDRQPQWVSIDEAAYLLGFRLAPSLYHRRKVNWLHKAGELITTRGQRKMDFLRTEVVEANQRIIDGIISLPSTI